MILTNKQKETLKKYIAVYEFYCKERYVTNRQALIEVLAIVYEVYGKRIDTTCPTCIFNNFEKIYKEYFNQKNKP